MADVCDKWFTVAYAYPADFKADLRYETTPHRDCLVAWEAFTALCGEHRVRRVGIVVVRDGDIDVRMIRERPDTADIGDVVRHAKDMPAVQAALLGCEPGESVPCGEHVTLDDVSQEITFRTVDISHADMETGG